MPKKKKESPVVEEHEEKLVEYQADIDDVDQNLVQLQNTFDIILAEAKNKNLNNTETDGKAFSFLLSLVFMSAQMVIELGLDPEEVFTFFTEYYDENILAMEQDEITETKQIKKDLSKLN